MGSYVPKIKNLEFGLELIETKDAEDADLDGMTKDMDKVLKKTKADIKKKQDLKKAADDDEKKKDYDAEYAYTP